jgi:tetratricopeptide (TPR) repeat protein
LSPFEPTLLRDGSRIQIVDYELIFHDPAFDPPDGEPRESTVLESLDDLSSARLARRSSQTAEAFRAVLEINRALGGVGDLDEMLGRALDGLMAVFPTAERGFILTAEPTGIPRPRAMRQRCGPAQPPALSRTVLRHVLSEGKAALIVDTALDSRFGGAKSLTSAVRTALCVPLAGHDGQPLGMVQLDRQTGTEGFRRGDLDRLAALAVPIGVAVENHRLLQERASWAAAREVQLALLPRRRPEIPEYAFWECFRPSLDVGGDLYELAWELATGPAALRDPKQALALAQKTVALAPDTAIYLNTLGVAQYRAGQYAEAIATLEKSLAASKGESDAFDLFFLAMARFKLGQVAQARADFDRAIQWRRDHPNLRQPGWSEELAAFQAEAEAVLARPTSELPDDVFAGPQESSVPLDADFRGPEIS